ncbi:hypothetical protein KEM56_007344 [Ascosphaera pollenicola]|nr:hypothetical protein KEM56_007344 [Ascosphaera pollenicola]
MADVSLRKGNAELHPPNPSDSGTVNALNRLHNYVSVIERQGHFDALKRMSHCNAPATALFADVSFARQTQHTRGECKTDNCKLTASQDDPTFLIPSRGLSILGDGLKSGHPISQHHEPNRSLVRLFEGAQQSFLLVLKYDPVRHIENMLKAAPNLTQEAFNDEALATAAES